MKILYDLSRVFGNLKTNTKEYIEVVNVSSRPTKYEVQLITKQVTAAADIWYLLASRVRFVGSPDRADEFKTQMQVMQAAAVLLMLWVQYNPVPKIPLKECIPVGDDFLSLQTLMSRQAFIIQAFKLTKCSDKKFLDTFVAKKDYYAKLLRDTMERSFCNGLTVQNSRANFAVLSRVFNPLTNTAQAQAVKSFTDDQNAVFISELTNMERVVLHCIIQSHQTTFHISNAMETKCTPIEALSLYYVCKVMEMNNNSTNRQAIAKAFNMLAGRVIKFVTANGVSTYPIFKATKLDFATGGASYQINDAFLQDAEVIAALKSYYNVERLTGLDAQSLLTLKFDTNIVLTGVEIANEVDYMDTVEACYSKKNIRKRMTYQPQKNWWRSLSNVMTLFGYDMNENPANKDEFIVKRHALPNGERHALPNGVK